MFSMENKTKVVCLCCKHTFPAQNSRIDKDSRLPQNYPCPVCKRITKIRVLPPLFG